LRQAPAAAPVVAVVPLIDHTVHNYEWNLSDEISSALYAQMAQQDHLRLLPSSRVRAKVTPLLAQHNPFDVDMGWMKKAFQEEEFVAFLELVEHEEVLADALKPQCNAELSSSELRVSVRLRLVDMRGKEPVVILQELIHDAHYIMPQFNRVNFYQVPWKDPQFDSSPIGVAHQKLTREIARRIDDYIRLALN
jgi:hypothetical protein